VEPVLRPDSTFERTDWGYKLRSLDLSNDADHPTIFTMEGYNGASRPTPNAYLRVDDGELIALRVTFGEGPRRDYVQVQASIRGTECSGGQFNLYDRRHAWDGHFIIEWIARQSWSNGKVGMYGQSYPGQTAYLTAATQPPSLAAVAPSLLHSDIYRDIFMPGGVQNYLFPTVWTYGTGPHRLPTGQLQNDGNALTQRQTPPSDEICAQLQTGRYSAGEPPQPQHEPAWAAVGSTDNDWYTSKAALTYAPSITIPYYQQTNWQDEQTGPRSVVLFHHIHPTPREVALPDGSTKTVVPKKFVTSSGTHGFGGYASRDRWTFFDIWVAGRPDTTGFHDTQVVNYFESRSNGEHIAKTSGQRWPFETTTWKDLYLGANGTLTDDPPAGPQRGDTYMSGVARQGWLFYAPDANTGSDITTKRGLPDAVGYESAPLTEDTAMAGPVLADIWASVAGVDTDFFVSVSEVWPDGSVSYVQRGLLKASHRAIDAGRSYYDQGRLVQPYRPHTNPQPVRPGEPTLFQIEVFPLGHIFRAGNRILVQVHTPPVVDGIWGYTPTHQPAAVTVLHDPQHPSRIQLPVVPTDAPLRTDLPLPGCRVPNGFPCAPKSRIP